MSPPLSRPPAGVPESGGSAKYAIVAVVLLLAAGGIYWWRSTTNRDQAPAPPPTVASVAPPPTNPKLDDIPPPPPPEVKPEAGTGGVKYVYVPGGGCDGKCSLSYSTPELGAALSVRGQQARRCYNAALANDSSLRGHVTIAVRIGPSGNVCSASVAANDMSSPSVAACAANIFRNASYPAPHGGCVDATVPLSFIPQGQ